MLMKVGIAHLALLCCECQSAHMKTQAMTSDKKCWCSFAPLLRRLLMFAAVGNNPAGSYLRLGCNVFLLALRICLATWRHRRGPLFSGKGLAACIGTHVSHTHSKWCPLTHHVLRRHLGFGLHIGSLRLRAKQMSWAIAKITIGNFSVG